MPNIRLLRYGIEHLKFCSAADNTRRALTCGLWVAYLQKCVPVNRYFQETRRLTKFLRYSGKPGLSAIAIVVRTVGGLMY